MRLYVEGFGRGGIDWWGTILLWCIVLAMLSIVALIPLMISEDHRQERERDACRARGGHPVDHSTTIYMLVGKIMMPVQAVDSIGCPDARHP